MCMIYLIVFTGRAYVSQSSSKLMKLSANISSSPLLVECSGSISFLWIFMCLPMADFVLSFFSHCSHCRSRWFFSVCLLNWAYTSLNLKRWGIQIGVNPSEELHNRVKEWPPYWVAQRSYWTASRSCLVKLNQLKCNH